MIERLRSRGPIAWLLFFAAVVGAIVGLFRNTQWFKENFFPQPSIAICSISLTDYGEIAIGDSDDTESFLDCLSGSNGKRIFVNLELWGAQSRWQEHLISAGWSDKTISECKRSIDDTYFGWVQQSYDDPKWSEQSYSVSFLVRSTLGCAVEYLLFDLSRAPLSSWSGPGTGVYKDYIQGFFRARHRGDIRLAFYFELESAEASPELVDEIMDAIGE